MLEGEEDPVADRHSHADQRTVPSQRVDGVAQHRLTSGGGLFPAAVNSANEEANRLFREGKIGFLQLGELIRTAFEITPEKPDFTLANVYDVDKAARAAVLSAVGA